MIYLLFTFMNVLMYFLFMYKWMSIHECLPQAHRCLWKPEGSSVPLGHPMWGQGAEFWFCRRTTRAFNLWTSALASTHSDFLIYFNGFKRGRGEVGGRNKRKGGETLWSGCKINKKNWIIKRKKRRKTIFKKPVSFLPRTFSVPSPALAAPKSLLRDEVPQATLALAAFAFVWPFTLICVRIF